MLSLGFFELLLLGVLALIFIGPRQLPEVAAFLLRTFNQVKGVVQEAGKQLSFSVEDLQKKTQEDPQEEETQEEVQKEAQEEAQEGAQKVLQEISPKEAQEGSQEET